MQISKSCIQSQDRSAGYLYLGILLFSSSSVGANEFATYIDMCMCMCVCVCNRNRKLRTSKAPLKSEAQGTSLFTSAASNQRVFPKNSPWEAQVRLPEGVCLCVCVCVCVRVRAWCLALMCSLLYYYGTISKHCYHSSLAVSELSKGQYNISSLQND